MGPIADSVAELIAAGERAVQEVRRECGYDADNFDALAYVEALEKKVREQAMALRIAGITVERQDELPYPRVTRPY